MKKTITAEAVITASDRSGRAFQSIANKFRHLSALAETANRKAAVATSRAGAIEKARGFAARGGVAGVARGGTFIAGPARFLGPGLAIAGGMAALKNYAAADLRIKRIGITADATEDEIRGLQEALRNLAFSTGKSFDEVSSGLESLVAGGMNLKEAMPAMPAIARTAQAAGAEIRDMADTTLALNQALGITPDKMQAAFDVLVTGGKEGKFELKDMARYFASLAPAAAAVGMKGEAGLQRIVALMQTVRAGTGTAEEAAASVSNIFAKMESEATVKKFSKFGIDLRKEMAQARKEGRDLLEVFVGLTDKATKGDLSKIPQLFTDMEFARGMRALMQYRDIFKDVTQRLASAGGSTMRDFNKVVDSSAVRIDRLSASWDRLMSSIGGGIDAAGGSRALDVVAAQIQKGIDFNEKGPAERERLMRYRERKGPLETELNGIDRLIAQTEADEKNPSWWQRVSKPLRERLRTGASRAQGTPLQKLRLDRMAMAGKMAALDNEFYMSSNPLFSAAEMEQWKEVWREGQRGRALTGLTGRGGVAGGLPLPQSDPRQRRSGLFENGHDLPPGAVKAELTGSAEVTGAAEVKLVVEPGSELIRIVKNWDSFRVEMNGRLNANGAGSRGTSSPDAKAGPALDF